MSNDGGWGLIDLYLVVDVLLEVGAHGVRGPLHGLLDDALAPVGHVLHHLLPLSLGVLQHDRLARVMTNLRNILPCYLSS